MARKAIMNCHLKRDFDRLTFGLVICLCPAFDNEGLLMHINKKQSVHVNHAAFQLLRHTYGENALGYAQVPCGCTCI